MERNPLRWPILCTAGIAVITIYCAFTLTSLALFPGPYSPVDNWLSDLGNSSYNPKGAAFYNAGCILTGLALFPFFAGLYRWYAGGWWRRRLIGATRAFGFLAAIALIMIGVYPEDYPVQHLFWSQAFFVLSLVVLILAGTSLVTHPYKFVRPVGYYGYAVAAINLALVTALTTPLVEWITVFTALGLVGLLVYSTFKLASPSRK